jgi:ADP-ribose pyrophosphatase
MPETRPLGRDDVDLLARTTVYQGRFRVDRYRFRHRTHRGDWSAPVEREVFERGHAAALLPYDPVRDEVVLIEQFRPGAFAAGMNPWLLEIVAGIIDKEGETPEQVARREAKEEANLAIAEVLPIADCILSPGGCSETISIFVGRTDSSGAHGVFGLAHEHEDIRVLTLSLAQAADRLARRAISNAVTVIALQWLLLNRMDLRNRWGAFER